MTKRFGFLFLFMVLATGVAVTPSAAQNILGDELTILIASPGEGESFYAAPNGFLLSIPIAGQVVSYESPLAPETVELTLDFIDSAGNHLQLTPPLDDSGFFEIWASIQPPNRPFVSDDPHDIEDCAICHRSSSDLRLSENVTHLVIRAQAQDGRTGQVVRNFYIEQSSFRELPVHIEGLPENASGLQVSASTVIFEWRRRTFIGPVNNAQAVLLVEGLAHADLLYEISLESFIADGILYSAPPQSVVVPGGTLAPPDVTLHAEPARASLAGEITLGDSGSAGEALVLAVDVFSGSAYTTTTDDGTFEFEDLPVADYVLHVRAPNGFHFPQRVNLTETLNAATQIHLTPAGTTLLSGIVTFEGKPLPFAQAEIAGRPIAFGDPLTGVFELDAVVAEGELPVNITAAGCYGVRLTTGDRDLGEVALSLHPTTQIIERGGARLYLPAQSNFTDNDGVITLNNGFLWVRGSDRSAEPPLKIQVGSYLIQGEEADFAIERNANGPARLYVSQGQVNVHHFVLGKSIYVMTGQSLALDESSEHSVDLLSGAGPVLRSWAGTVTPFEESPSAAARISHTVYQVIVLCAKVVMGLAYAISIIGPVLFTVGLLGYLVRRRNAAANRS